MVEFVSVFTKVTVAPEMAAPWGSITVPRREARYCACPNETTRVRKQNSNGIRRKKVEPFMMGTPIEKSCDLISGMAEGQSSNSEGCVLICSVPALQLTKFLSLLSLAVTKYKRQKQITLRFLSCGRMEKP